MLCTSLFQFNSLPDLRQFSWRGLQQSFCNLFSVSNIWASHFCQAWSKNMQYNVQIFWIYTAAHSITLYSTIRLTAAHWTKVSSKVYLYFLLCICICICTTQWITACSAKVSSKCAALVHSYQYFCICILRFVFVSIFLYLYFCICTCTTQCSALS